MKDQLRRSLRAVGVALAAGVMAIGWSACGGSSSGDEKTGEVVITCAACQRSPTDPFIQHNYEVVQRFNRKYAGRYRVEVKQNQYAGDSTERVQYYQRLALANDLPDLFNLDTSELRVLQDTRRLMDFRPTLDADPSWRDAFFDGGFTAFTDDAGHIYGIPTQRDAIGIYYNRAILSAAGVDEFPRTWDELESTCKRVVATGKICLAMDGDWSTLLMWADMIGTHPDNQDFLLDGITTGDYASNPAVVEATERLQRWHREGFVNRDAYSGDFENASTPFLTGEAAMLANGPWYVSSGLKTRDASRGLYEHVGYAPSPGWTADARGAIVVSEGAWVSGASTDAKREAVHAFLKFVTSHDEALSKMQALSSYPPVEIKLSPQETARIEPLSRNLADEVEDLKLIFPHVYTRSPSGFQNAWKNLWPAYARGEMSTDAFLTKLGQDATSPTG